MDLLESAKQDVKEGLESKTAEKRRALAYASGGLRLLLRFLIRSWFNKWSVVRGE